MRRTPPEPKRPANTCAEESVTGRSSNGKLLQKLRRRKDGEAAPGMQDKQVMIAAHDDIGLGRKRQGQDELIFRVATAASRLHLQRFRHNEKLRMGADRCDQCHPGVEIHVRVESFFIQNLLKLFESPITGT
jgi:hypothetical protein